jgi:hypothetical protein
MLNSSDEPSLSALKVLRDEVLQRLLRDSADFRTYRALSDAIDLFHSKGQPGITDRDPSHRRRGRKSLDSILGEANSRTRRFVSQREAAELALATRQVPLTIKELLAEVAGHGAVVGGVRPQATLSSNLSQDPRFILVPFAGRLCWWLADQPVPSEPVTEPEADRADTDDMRQQVVHA